MKSFGLLPIFGNETIIRHCRVSFGKIRIEFESFFISHMLHQMRESTRTIAPDDSPTKDKVNQDMTDMVDNMLAGNMAHQRAFGVADAILRQILPAPLNKTS